MLGHPTTDKWCVRAICGARLHTRSVGKPQKDRNWHQINISECHCIWIIAERSAARGPHHHLRETHPAVMAVPGESGRQPEGRGRWEDWEGGEEKER